MIKISNSGIYKITNLVNGKFYLGSAINFKNRCKNHISCLKRNKHINIHLQNAWNLYGENNFSIELIEKVSLLEEETRKDFCKRLVDGREQYYLNILLFANQKDSRFFELGYNINRVATSALGRKLSDETKEKIRIGNLGNKASAETKEKMKNSNSGKNNGFYGKTHTKEIIEYLRNINKGRKRTKETIMKTSKALEKPVLQYTLNNDFIKRWESVKKASLELNIPRPNISEACVRTRRKQAGGFVWKYEYK